jgi:hypothetical protein
MRRALALLALLCLAACSSSNHKGAAAAGASTAPSSSTTPSTTTTAGASPSTGASGVPGASAGSSASPAATAGGASTAPHATAGATAASKATPRGTYTYDSSGTSSPGGDVSSTSTLTVSEVIDGSQTGTLHNSQGDTEQNLLVRQNGSYLASLSISSPTLKQEFTFSPPALLLADPAKVGATWSWSGTSTDGSTKVNASNKVLRTETVTVGGQRVATVVLQTHLVITGKNLSYTADETNWVAPAYRLPVRTRTVGKGTYGAFPFSFDVTDVLRSVHPA